MPAATVKKITPILFAQEIESCIRFWTERMGFENLVEMPEARRLVLSCCKKMAWN